VVAKANPVDDVRRQELALGLLAAGAPKSMVVATLRTKEGLSRGQAERVFLAVCEVARAEYEDARPYLKALQVERLQRDLASMRAAGKGRVSYRSVAQHEALLARVLGTLEPVKTEVSVDATVRESLVAVVAGMDRDRMDALVAEQLALEAAAGHLALDVPGEVVRAGSGGSDGGAGESRG
jgi:hypothetical protein